MVSARSHRLEVVAALCCHASGKIHACGVAQNRSFICAGVMCTVGYDCAHTHTHTRDRMRACGCLGMQIDEGGMLLPGGCCRQPAGGAAGCPGCSGECPQSAPRRGRLAERLPVSPCRCAVFRRMCRVPQMVLVRSGSWHETQAFCSCLSFVGVCGGAVCARCGTALHVAVACLSPWLEVCRQVKAGVVYQLR